MGRKRKRHHENKAAAATQKEEDGDGASTQNLAYNSTPADAPCRLLALQPGGGLALAFGKRMRVTSDGAEAPATLAADGEHAATIRTLAFDSTGAWLLSADDSKTVRLWRTEDWTITHTFTAGKKPTCGAFSLDGAYAFVADKFGDVTVASTATGASALLLGHYCSTISSLAVSPDGRYLATADRDNKVRVSILPAEPLEGAHDIQTYCLGHTAFVTAVSFVQSDNGATAVVTASGDGSVRLWNHMTGEQLADVQLTHPPDSSEAAAAAGNEAAEVPADASGVSSPTGESSGQLPDASASGAGATSGAGAAEDSHDDAAATAAGSQPSAQAGGTDADADADAEELEVSGSTCQQPVMCPAITTLTASTKSGVVAVAVEGRDAVALLSVSVRIGRNCGRTKGTLSRLGAVAHQQVQLPTSLAFDDAGRLWTAGGPLTGGDAGRLCLGVMQPASAEIDSQVLCVTADSRCQWLLICGTQEFVDVTEAHATGAVAAAAAACALSDAELRLPEQLAATNGQLGGHLKKKVYRREEIESRKRNRNDVQLKTAAAAGQAAREDQALD